MNDFAALLFFATISLFAIAFTVRRYRTAPPEQRSQIAFAAVGTVLVAGGVACLFALR